jgi:hypothetical protein
MYIKKPCQNNDRSCQNNDRSLATVRSFGIGPEDIIALPSSTLSPIGKLVFIAYANKSKGTDAAVCISDGKLALKCGCSRTAVLAGRKQLVKIGRLVEAGSPIRQVQPYKIYHPYFQARVNFGTVDTERRSPDAALQCADCKRKVKRLGTAGMCRSCVTDAEYRVKLKEAKAANPGLEAEELAVWIKDRIGLRRITTRVRRLLREDAKCEEAVA